MDRKTIITFAFCFVAVHSFYYSDAQNTGMFLKRVSDAVFTPKDTILHQKLAGRVFEKETLIPLSGATVIVRMEDGKYYGRSTDENGDFSVDQIRIGRYELEVSYVGYTTVRHSVTISSTRTVHIDVPMEPSAFYLTAIDVTASQDLAPIGGSVIDNNQFKFHPGNRYESIRKVAVLPGIQNADDSRNDIIIRGNSPQSVSWRLEGVNVPNPNHFNIPGTSGGSISTINDKLLGTSQFYSGAFPAEYGNTTSGIFDLRFRSGDSTRFHGTLQFGFLGAELVAEGPLSKKRNSSFIVSARKSVLGLFSKFNIDIGTSSVPVYGDLAFKVDIPSKKRDANYWVFGLGGKSAIDLLISKQKDFSHNIYGEKDRDQYFSSNLAVAGAGYKKRGAHGYVSGTLAYVSSVVDSHHEFAFPADKREAILQAVPPAALSDTLPIVLHYRFHEQRISGAIHTVRKISGRSNLTFGVNADLYNFNYLDSSLVIDPAHVRYGEWRRRWDSKTNAIMVQPYTQWSYSGNKVDFSAGLHGQYFTLTRSASVEPRLLARYHASNKSSFNAGVGLHSQMHQPYLYFYGSDNHPDGAPRLFNRNMGFTRSVHGLTGFQKTLGSDSSGLRLKVEAYYQWLYNVPVERISSDFSLVNAGADFLRQHPNPLKNSGTGKNYGVEALLEKSFSRGYMFLVSGTVFRSRYRGSDMVWRNTDFNAQYIFNALMTREWQLSKRNVLAVGGKITLAGGRWHGVVDSTASRQHSEVRYVAGTQNTKQFEPYFRFDLRFTYTINLGRVDHEFSVDLINIFNSKSIRKLTWVPDPYETEKSKVVSEYQLGFIPFFYYRLDF